MAVIEWGYAPGNGDGSENDKGLRSHTIKYRAVCDSVYDDDIVVLNYYLCPGRGDYYQFYGANGSYSWDNASRVKSRQAVREADNLPIWEVTIKYEGTEGEEDEDEDPLNEPVEARGSGESYTEVAQGTASSSAGFNFEHAIANSAGEPFRNPTPEKMIGFNVLQLVKNHPIDFDILALNDDYAFTVSTDAFFGRPAGRWMFFPVTWELKRKEATKTQPAKDYLRCTYTFKNKPKGWRPEYVDIGSYYIGEGPLAGKKVAFKTSDGQAYLGLLDGAGGKLFEGGVPQFRGPFKIQDEKAFAALNLPNSLEECKKFLR